MKTYVIDTNALISFVADRNLDQQDNIAPIFQSAARLKGMILCPQNVLTEFIYVLEKVYHHPKSEIHMMVGDLIAMPGVRLVKEVDLKRVLAYWPEHISDFGDAIVAAVCRAYKESLVATFDSKLITSLKKLGLAVVTL